MPSLKIRPALDADLPALVEALGQRRFFADRINRQRAGRGVLLVAWLGGRPVGDVYLWEGPADEPEVRTHLPGVPLLNHLEVVSALRRRGIGTALIRAAEEAARQRGHDRIALGVGFDNPDAWRLYERLGYADWGHGPVVAHWQEPGDDGSLVEVSLTCGVLAKHL